MLVDAAKYGDVEIPVFCYEPKLGQPVGACRMCLVEIEGIPKLQTGCSTPVKDGMVVHTQTAARARRAARGGRVPAHQPPARLPGLRQGRRVPAAGHHLRLGPRHVALHRAQAPLPQAARALAADRDRPRALHPLLPLRALLAGDLRGLPADPLRARRALLRLHVRRAPVRRPVQRQHHRALPRRRADVDGLPLPRAPVGHRGRGHGLHLLPVAVQRRADRPRRPRDARARARPRRGRRRLAVRQGPLRLPVHARRRAHHAAARARGHAADAGELGEGARRRRGRARRRRGAKAAALAGGDTTNEEAFLLARLFREGLGSRHARRLARARAARRACSRALADPALQATVPDLEFAHAVLVLDCEPVDDAPILDLRMRKGVRRHGVQARRRERAGRARWTRTPRPSLRYRARRRRGAAGRPRRRALGRRRQPRRRGHRGGLQRRRPCATSPSFLAGAGERRRDPLRRAAADRRARRVTPRSALLNVAAAARPRRPRRRRAARDPVRDERARHPRGRLRARATARATPTRAAGEPTSADAATGRALPAARRPGAHARRPRALGGGARAARRRSSRTPRR